MAKVLDNIKLNDEYFVIKVLEENKAEAGQFYMVRSWDKYPVLSRPISIFDRDDNTISFLFKLKGEGTKIFSELEKNDDILLEGPYGNHFPKVKGRIAMIGGGIGIAPLYYAAKVNKQMGNKVDIFFSLRRNEILRKELESVSDNLTLKVNSRVTGLVDFSKYDYIFTCGPESLMKDMYFSSKAYDLEVYVSAENRMGCGIGICYVCTCKTKEGNKLVCKDGPIFKGDILYEQ